MRPGERGVKSKGTTCIAVCSVDEHGAGECSRTGDHAGCRHEYRYSPIRPGRPTGSRHVHDCSPTVRADAYSENNRVVAHN